MITIDFETRSATDLTKVGSHVYASDPTTELLCLAWKFKNSPARLWAPERLARIADYRIDDPKELFEAIERGELVEAHNSGFERRIWSLIGVTRHGWPEVPFDSWRCSMAQAAAMGLPQNLGLLAKSLGVKERKDKFGNAAMRELTKPLKRKKRDPNQGTLFDPGSGPVFNEDPIKLAAVFDYCKQDVRTEEAVSDKLNPLSDRELRIWQLDQRINDRGFFIDRRLCESAIKSTQSVDKIRNAELKTITKGSVTTANQTKKIKEFVSANGYPIDTLKAEVVETMLAGSVSGVNRRVLEIRLETAKSSVKKFKSLLLRSSVDGRMRDILRYYGAFTGRWSGAGAQIQNFPRGSIQDMDDLAEMFLDEDFDLLEAWYGDIHESAKSVTRGSLVAAPGNKLLVWDFGQIEARAIAWLANDPVFLEVFRAYDAGEGPDPYVVLARDIFSNQRITKETHPEQRQVGKAGILGLGYQMGKDTFLEELEKYGVENATLQFSQDVVTTFREKFKLVVEFWYRLERAAKHTVKTGRSTTVNRIRFVKRGRFLLMTLPSGRSLFYFDAKLKTYTNRWGKQQTSIAYRQVKNKQLIEVVTYGGKLAENATQGTAADLLRDGMVALDSAGYPLNATIHDEIVAEVPANDESRTLNRGKLILEVNEPWSYGLPLVADGFETKRYRKD